MALIDALMAGQQFVSGIQQQQQMAREYRDRMAALARQEERAMRQEQLGLMDFMRQGAFQERQMGLMESQEARAVEESERSAQESEQRIQVNNLEIARLRREAERAPTIEAQQDALLEIQRITAENEQLAANLQIRVAQGELAAQEAALASQKEFGRVQSALTNVARQVQLDPAALTAEQALAAEQTMYDFIDRNPAQVQALSPYYNAFFKALEQAEKAEGSLLTKKGIRSQYAARYKMPATSGNFAGPSQVVDPRQVLSRENYMSGLESAYDPLEQYQNLRDRRQNFLNIVGQPFVDALVSMLPQED